MTNAIIGRIYSQGSTAYAVCCSELVNLNTVPADLLAGMSDVGPARAEALIQRRPFRDWDDVERVPGISESIIERLKSAGADLA